MKRVLSVAAFVLALLLLWLLLASDACIHQWDGANCTSPRTCSQCGKKEGAALGHDWLDATCEQSQTCVRCHAVTGPALGHQWVEATCEAPRTCMRCSIADGEALPHAWDHADCENPKTCSNCGAQEGEPVGHLWREYESRTRKYCRVCHIEAPGPMTLEQAYPPGELRFADGYFLMDVKDYLDLYMQALDDAGYQYWFVEDSEYWENGHLLYPLVEMTTGSVITVMFLTDPSGKTYTISVDCDVSGLDDDVTQATMDAANISFDVAHGAMSDEKWRNLAEEQSCITANGVYMIRSVYDGLGCITAVDTTNLHYEVVAAADMSRLSWFND